MKPTTLLPLFSAVLLLAACTQRLEPELKPGSGGGSVISFSSPIIAPATNPRRQGQASSPQSANASHGKPIAQAHNSASRAQSPSTKALTDLPISSSFCVFACYYSGSFSTWSAGLPYFGPSGEIFSHHSGVLSDGATIYDAWRSATKHYWPIQGSLSFQAYSPAGESIPSGNSISPITAGDPIIGSTGVRAAVTLSPERGDQIDFLSSERVVNQSHNTRYPASEEDEANLYGVQLPFHHTLARFSFSAMLRSSIPEGDYIKITRIRVHNAYLSGTFEQNLADSTPGGTLSASSTSWATTGALSSYANSVAPSPSNLGTRPSGSDYSPIYLIPQEMSEGFQIEVQYERLKAATSPTPALHTVYISKAELEAALGTAQLLRGKSYNFTFLLGEENKIYFEPLVNEWRGQDLSGHIHYEF